MSRYKLVVMSNPVAGREAEYDDWYQNSHLQQMIDVPGVVSAQRYRPAEILSVREPVKFLTIYEVETNDIKAFLQELLGRARAGKVTSSDTMQADSVYGVFYEPIGAEMKS
jgi:hypothetical protein